MTFYLMKYDYPWSNQWHVVKAKTRKEAIEKFIKNTRIPEHKVKIWKRKGMLPENLAGRYLLPKGWKP